MLVATLVIPGLTVPRLLLKEQEGLDIWSFRSPCALK